LTSTSYYVSSLSTGISSLSTSTSYYVSSLSSAINTTQILETTTVIVPLNTYTVPNGQEPAFYVPYSLSTTPFVDGWYYNSANFPSNYSASQTSNYINWNIIPIDLKGNTGIPYNNVTQVYALIHFPNGQYNATNLPFIQVNCNNSTTLKYVYSATSLYVPNAFNGGQNQLFQCILSPSLTTGQTVTYGNVRILSSIITGSVSTGTIINSITINTSAIANYASAVTTPSPQNFIVQDLFIEQVQGTSIMNKTIDYKFTTANVINKYLYRVVNDIYLQQTKGSYSLSSVFLAPNYILNSTMSYIG